MTYDRKTSTATVEEAIVALADLGVTGSADLGSSHDPDLVVGWCRWAKERRDSGQDIGTGLVVRNIKLGEAPPKNVTRTVRDRDRELERLQAERRARFDAIAARFPEGSVTETCADAERRRLRRRGVDPPPEDQLCPGGLVVIDTTGMVLAVRCDECGEETTYPWRALNVLPDKAVLSHCPEPPRPAAVPAGAMAASLARSLKRFNPKVILGRIEREGEKT